MNVVHVFQPASCPPPPWGGDDQRADSPGRVIADLQRLESGHRAIVMGGSTARRECELMGVKADPLAPALGASFLATRSLASRLPSGRSGDVLVGWGLQFRRVFDMIRPRAACLVVDLRTGALHGRSAATTSWESGPTLPARVHGPVLPAPSIPTGALRIGLCWDGPAACPTVAFTFTLGVVSTSGVPTTAVIKRGAPHGARLARHAREGGRLAGVLPFEGAIALHSDLADCWLFAVPSRAAHVEPPFTDWSTMVLADLLASAGVNVLGVGDGCNWLAPELRARARMIPGSTLADAAAGLIGALGAPAVAGSAVGTESAAMVIQAATRRVARGEPLGTLGVKEHRHAG